jgi:hypothetical protein
MQIPNFNAKGSLFTEREGSARGLLTKIEECKDISLYPLNSMGWTMARLTTTESLLPDPMPHAESFEYNLLYRQGRKSHCLMVAEHKAVIVHIIKLTEMGTRLFAPIVDIGKLVQHLAELPTIYTLSAVHSNVEGYGQSLRNISFYGTDVGEALLFREMLPKTPPYRVTLNDIPHQNEIISISNSGSISFSTNRGERALQEVDLALAFLSRNEFLRWEVE